MSRVILHCDMNNFYASVECMLNPALKDKPLAVCGDTAERHGIVLAKNYIASSFGIKTAETVWSAKQKCRELVIVSPHFDEYMKISLLAREIYKKYTSLVEPFGLDESWLDISAIAPTLKDGELIAHSIRKRIKNELGVTVSIGVSFNKSFAKLASDIRKPDAVTVIPKESYLDFIGALPASSLIGVGGTTAEKLSTYCVETISDLASFSQNMLVKLFGKMGRELWEKANGLDASEVVARELEELDKSVGNGVTASTDLEAPDEVWRLMLELSQELGHKLLTSNKKACTVAIQIKDNTLNVKQWQCQPKQPTQSAYEIAKTAFDLFSSSYNWERPIRAVTVRATNLIESGKPSQLGIFDVKKEDKKTGSVEKTVEELRYRFGGNIIKNGSVMSKREK